MSPPLTSTEFHLIDEHSTARDSVLPSNEPFNGPTIKPIDRLLEKALAHLRFITPAYRTTPLPTSFNWDEVASELDPSASGNWYIVAFRSVRRADANHRQLYEADRDAHEEAKNSGGILKYWYGDLNDRHECLAMCVWADREFARRATGGPKHIKAMMLAGRMYDTYRLERYWLIKKKGERGFRIQEIVQ